jgi:hypothetical protein
MSVGAPSVAPSSNAVAVLECRASGCECEHEGAMSDCCCVSADRPPPKPSGTPETRETERRPEAPTMSDRAPFHGAARAIAKPLRVLSGPTLTGRPDCSCGDRESISTASGSGGIVRSEPSTDVSLERERTWTARTMRDPHYDLRREPAAPPPKDERRS